MDISFSGAGFMGCYYFGVVDCWNKYVPRNRVNRVAGASAGSLIAAYYLMDLPLNACVREIIELTEDIRSRPLGVFDRSNQIVDLLPQLLDRLLPEDAHKQVSGRLHVCMTRLKDMKKVLVNEFESKKDLIDALNCSCFIPLWSGDHVSTFRGVKHIDGGFSDNLPVFDEHTVRVCCFSGASDISPYDRAKMELLSGTVFNTPLYLNFANCRRFRKALFPPPAAYIVDLLERGFHDAKDFILSNDLIQCNSCYGKADPRSQPIFARPRPTLTPSVSPALSRVGSIQPGARAAPPPLQAPATPRAFNSLLQERLERVGSPDSALGQSEQERAQSLESLHSGGPGTPTVAPAAAPPEIVIEDADKTEDSAIESDSSWSETGAGQPELRLSQPADTRFRPMLRRNTLAQLASADSNPSLLAVEAKFKLAPNPLPSCPPSPTLNRHCTECIRLRQEARMDQLEEEIMLEVDKYRGIRRAPRESKLKSILASPIRWLRQLGTKTSYEFQTSA